MPSLMERVRSLFGMAQPNPEHDEVLSRLRKQADRLRVARIDAGLPVDRRHIRSSVHPRRRANDR